MSNKMKYEKGGPTKGGYKPRAPEGLRNDGPPLTKDGWFKRNMKELMTEFRDNHEDHGGDQKFYISNKAFMSFANNKYNKIKNRLNSKPAQKTTVKEGANAYKTGGFLEPGIESID